jgi:DNA segregation ATPase FtsK/SpoIIIE, S-DNA-T family
MNKGRLSNFAAVILGFLGLFFLITLVLSFYGVGNAPGDFLIDSFTYASFFIPIYIIISAVLSYKEKFRIKWVIILTFTILPFLTMVIFLKVYFNIDNSISVRFINNFIGRKEGSFLLFLVLLVEILLIYVLSMKFSKVQSKVSSVNEVSLSEKSMDNISETKTVEHSDDIYSIPSILRPGISAERLGTSLSESPVTIKTSSYEDLSLEEVTSDSIETLQPIELDVLGTKEKINSDLPELQALNNLESIYSESEENDKGFSIDYGDDLDEEDEEMFVPDDIREIDKYDKLFLENEDSNLTGNPVLEEEVFLDIGDDHLINIDEPDNGEGENNISEKPEIKTNKKFTYSNYSVPSKNILNDYSDGNYWVIDDQTRLAAGILKETLEEFKIKADVTGIKKGPVITMFEILPAPGVKLSKIANLADNIAMRLAASRIRIVAPIPGKHAVGIEIPNKERAKVSFKEMLQDDKFQDSKNEIPVAIGKDITGNTQIIDLVKTPHLLIAGATGSGKSVCVNALICSILYKRSPDEVRLLLIDPKIVELKLYNGIPHLLTPVITEPKRAFQALQYCIYIMEQRYALLDGMGVRDIRSYNKKIIKKRIATKKLPYIVVIVDEFADLIATSGKELESILARLAAMARAVGIHLVLATQRPSIDVITGLIKANIPSRIAFMVSNKIDSRIILDTSGADKLLGQGDMLFSSAWDPSLTRIQGAFLSDAEVESVTEYVKTLGEPDYIDDEIFYDDESDDNADNITSAVSDPLMDKAVDIVVLAGKASASYLQRRLQIGYNRAARIVEDMEARGIVGPPNGSKPRDILHVPDRSRVIEPGDS